MRQGVTLICLHIRTELGSDIYTREKKISNTDTSRIYSIKICEPHNSSLVVANARLAKKIASSYDIYAKVGP